MPTCAGEYFVGIQFQNVAAALVFEKALLAISEEDPQLQNDAIPRNVNRGPRFGKGWSCVGLIAGVEAFWCKGCLSIHCASCFSTKVCFRICFMSLHHIVIDPPLYWKRAARGNHDSDMIFDISDTTFGLSGWRFSKLAVEANETYPTKGPKGIGMYLLLIFKSHITIDS